MKITMAIHGETVSIENDHDDVTMEELVQLLRQLCVGAGFAESTVIEWLGTE